MVSGTVLNQGKTPFTREQLEKDPAADADSISEAWQSSGHDGTISASLVYKIKTDMGLTGRGKVGRPPKSVAAGLKRTKPRGRPRKNPLPTAAPAPAPATGRRSAPAAAASHDEDSVLDELEDAIDTLIGKIKQVGEHTEAVRALRKARRLLGHPQG